MGILDTFTFVSLRTVVLAGFANGVEVKTAVIQQRWQELVNDQKHCKLNGRASEVLQLEYR